MAPNARPEEMPSISERIDRLDISLFRTIEGQSSEDDRRSLLALQSACRQWKAGPYSVLEIGSYEGGSLQGHVADPSCGQIISIDARPTMVPDERGGTWDYSHVTADQMLARLADVPGADVSKVKVFTAGTDSVRVADLGCQPDLCFIDGEHTDAAMLRDARFCVSAAGPDCAIALHDANIVYKGLRTLVGELEASGRAFRAYPLASVTFVIELGACRLSEYEPLRSWRAQNYKGYLASLEQNDHYRETARRYQRLARHPLLRWPRKIGLVGAVKKRLGC